MSLRCEVWTRPGDSSYQRRIADLPLEPGGSGALRRNSVGDITLVVPSSYDRIAEVVDPPDGASYGGVSSTLRIYDGATLVCEAIPTDLVPTEALGDHNVQINAVAIPSILSYGRLEPFDWTGADTEQSLFPDWLFGAPNLIDDGDFENLGIGAVYQLYIGEETYSISSDATGGTYTLTVGANTTSAIAYDASASTVETELEALASVTDVVTSSFEDGSIRVRFVDPENVSPDMSITDSTTGGTTTLTKVDDGFSKTGTTFTLTVDGDTTSGLDWDVSALGIENNVQGLSTVADITVEGSGNIDDPWIIVFYDPIEPPTFTVDDSGLSGGTAYLTSISSAETSIGKWTVSQFADQRVDVAQHGSTSLFELSSTANSGDYSLSFRADRQFGGVQRVFDVTPGSTIQVSLWVRASSASDLFRVILRGVVDELDNPIVGFPSVTGDFSLTANTWTEITFSDVEIPPGIDRVLLRFAYTGTTGMTVSTAYIDDVVIYEGLPAGTPGYIARTLYEDMTDDHGSGNEIAWDNGAGSPYLTLNFTDSVDSDGNAWTNSDVAIDFLKGQSFLRCITELAKTADSAGPLEWEVVPNSVTAGTYYLNLYNAGGLPSGYDLSGSDTSPVVRGGKDTVRRSVRAFLPTATDLAIEGADFTISRTRNAAAVAALGKIGGYVPNEDLPDSTATDRAAAVELAARLAASQSLVYTLVPDATDWRPLVDYGIGYTILVEDEPLISKAAHQVDAVRFTIGPGPTEYQVHFEAESFVGSEALHESVRALLGVFKGIRPDDTGGAAIASSGAAIPWLVAASDSPDGWIASAGYLCTGSDDGPQIEACLARFGLAWLAPGQFVLTVADESNGAGVTMPDQSDLVGLVSAETGGTYEAELFTSSNPASVQRDIVLAGDGCRIEHVTCVAFNGYVRGIRTSGGGNIISRCRIETAGGDGIYLGSSSTPSWVKDNYVDVNDEDTIGVVGIYSFNPGCHIVDNEVISAGQGIRVETAGL